MVVTVPEKSLGVLSTVNYHVRSLQLEPHPVLSISSLMPAEHQHSVILVTGGTGLVGYAIQHVIETEPVGSRFGKRGGEKWVFIGSKEADLRYVSNSITRPL